MFKIDRILPEFVIQISDSSRILSPEIEQKISKIWDLEKAKKGGALFNGKVLSMNSFHNGVLDVSITDYRSHLAQMREPRLYNVLQIRTLAISGMVRLDNKIIFGKRADNLLQDTGKWELVPSGTLTLNSQNSNGSLAVEEQFFEELNEELGLAPSLVASIHPFLLIEDKRSHVIDIGVDVLLKDRASEIDFSSIKRTDEYSQISWIEINNLDQFVKDKQGQVVEVSLELLKAKSLFKSLK